MKLPKFYNPFKPHIVQFANGKFAVRRRIFIGWEYKERTEFNNSDCEYWWYKVEYVKKYCMVDTHEQAVILRDKTNRKSMEVVKVYG